ncbi:hypothetical protein [Parasphingorhabdus marina]|uniref:hypothetical protein n=1 Tax=Parasphingorhabdus marina TaxID=394732 RepID=UPI0009416088|nr:hypothetical protein [Parasphingorhabdus marina]
MITAIWMLLLGASIVAILMARNLHQSEQYSFEREQIAHRYALDSAVENVAADLLFNGPRSTFAQLPNETGYSIGGVNVTVKVSSESGKIDVNQADIALVERALRGLAASAQSREVFLDQIKASRAADRPFQSALDIAAALQQSGLCGGSIQEDLGQFFTAYSGLAQPQQGQIDPQLARALGQPHVGSGGRTRPGTAIRVEARSEQEQVQVAVLRVGGSLSQSHVLVDWFQSGVCR